MKKGFVLGTAIVLFGVFGTNEARADDCANDMPMPWREAPCWIGDRDVCVYTTNKIECYGSSGKDAMMIISSNNDPIAYGILDIGGADDYFCCDVAEMDDDTWPLYIELGDDNDDLCLNDDNHGWCSNVLGANPWPAAATILAGIGNDRIDTAFAGGAYTDYIELGAGDDVAYTWAGADEVYGQADNDSIYLGDGNDFGDGGPGADALYGNAGVDTLVGGGGGSIGTPDYLDGGSGIGDCLCGGATGSGLNDDGVGYDTMVGGADSGDMCYWFNSSYDTVNCESDSETDTCGC
jgi:Ca2+-binding RTX toxin-like protein